MTQLVQINPSTKAGTVVVDTGVGKCKIAIDFINAHDDIHKVLITSPRENLKKNWMDELSKWGYEVALLSELAMIQAIRSETIYYAIPNGFNAPRTVSITFANIQTAYKWTNEYFDLIILDEAHLCLTPEYSAVIPNNRPLYAIGLTATPDITARGKEDKLALYQSLCPIIYEFTDAEQHGIVNETKIIVIDHELSDEIKVVGGTKKSPFLLGELKQYSYICSTLETGQKMMAGVGSKNFFNDAAEWYWDGLGDIRQIAAARVYLTAIRKRTDFLLTLPSTASIANKLARKLFAKDESSKILVFSERTNQIDRICKYSVHSKNKKEINEDNLLRFNNGDIRVLGSCYSLTLGLNMKAANYSIFESYQGSETKATQRAGRLHRLPVGEIATIYIIRVLNTRAEKWFNQITDKASISEVISSKSI